MTKKLLSITLLLFSTSTFLFAQTEVALEASKDNTLYEHGTGALSNGAGVHLFAGRTNQNEGFALRRALVAFDVAGEIPAGATITATSLTLNMSKSNASATNVSLHRVTSAWGEGTSDAAANEGGGVSATTDDATWIHTFFDSATWTSPGGDYEAPASATQTVDALGSYTWESAQLTADVQAWLDNPTENFGWILIGDESTEITSKRFDSRENTVAANRPALAVTYMTATASEDDTTPEGYDLAQNYPNPFNPVTTITYTIPSTQRVEIAVYDAFGRVVARLVGATLPAGTHTTTFDASGLASGVYTYRLTTPAYGRTRQLAVLK